ncbi:MULTISPECIES: Lrp/AsnC family transcriptional regulator [Amycolatopsis]|uniref:Lrp/AsnC family transcriptional regulator, leucine-responsive regulatory protein n=2 Tax=Amycolatopsis TaxID=1813 RepID=A0A1I3KNS3_9PSEU|nr:Lrp/AsnC family transcriptional regulator [Amycolatopsis sacchari]SFI74010.1 Lrp/AsnC family transcriptional regulator, leucine-responsive regulatory protein [Amycolatopsis sacchari]
MSATPGPLEPLDQAIARELAVDGRCSFTDLAERVGLSVSAVHQRVRRLEQRGVIRGYAAQLDGELIGLPLTALISLTPNDPAAPDDYPQRLEHITEIESCYSVAGDESYILLVRVASPRALEDLLRRIREAAKVSTRTTVVLSTPFEGRTPMLSP